MEKQYLDYEGFEHTIERLRRKEMPTASVDYVGQIVQYVGGTNASYTKGYYYECVSDGKTPATYSWVQRNIQPKENIPFVTPEQFGAIGDGVTDDTDAFTAAFAACPNVKCDGSKTYKFTGIIINDNAASDLDLCGATLLNFHIKVRIAADGYKSSDPYSSNFFKMHDGHLGKFTELPSDWQTPAIQCGSQLWLENLVFANTPYIVALTNNYRDRMVFKNLLMLNDSSLWTGITWELDAINLITGNGTFARINAYDVSNVATDTNSFAGDGWVIDNIDEFRSNLQPDYFFIHTYNQHTLNINRCIQTRIAIGTNTHVEFSNCHFENVNAMPVVETLTDSSTPAASALYQVDFDNCWFTDRYVLEADKPNVSYTNCYFRCCSNAHDPTIPFATIMGECDFYNVNCKIIDCVFDVDKCVINSEKWKGYKAQPKRTRNSNNNTANEGTLANSIEAIKDIASGNYKYPATGTYNYVGYAFNNSTCNDDSNSSRIAHEKYEWTRTVSSVDSDMDGSTAILNTVGGWGFEIYRTLPDGTIQRARFYDSPIEDGPKNVTQKKFHIREYGNYLVINKTVSFGSTYTETGYRLPWTTVTSIPNYTVNAQVYEKNGVLVTLDGSTIPGLTNKSYAQVSDNYSITRYNVLDYGLKGDNSTDNSDAFEALLAQLPRYGTAVIYFPQGRYRFSRPIVINDSNGVTGVTLIGDTVVGKSYSDGTSNGCPDSTLIYTGDANTTFIKGGSNCWFFNVHGLHFTCIDGFNFTLNDAAFSEIPYNVFTSSTTKDGIIGIGKSNSLDVSDCVFSGFSGCGVETVVHTTVKDSTFFKCKIGINAEYDTIINDCWFNYCGTAVVAKRAGESSSQNWSTLIMNDTWIDQCTRGIHCPASKITMWLVGIMFDMFDEAAIYCEGKILDSLIIGHIQRAGMKYADLADSDRTTALVPETDAIVASQILNTKIDIASRRRSIGKGNHSSGMCPSRLVTATTISESSISNQGFAYERIYDPDMVTLSNTAIYAGDRSNNDANGMYKVYSGTYDSVEGEFYDADGNALPKIDQQQYYDITTRTTWIYYSAWSGFFRLFNDVVGMESSQMLSPLITQYYPELNTARFRCMNTSGNDGGLIEGFIYKLDRISVTPEAGDSPVDEGWWEVDSTTGKTIQTEDTEVVSGKLYFDYVWTQVKTQQSVFPGTLDEWNALTEAEKAKYDFIASPEEADIDIAINTYSNLICNKEWINDWNTFGTSFNTFYRFIVPYAGKYKLHSSLIYNINNTDAIHVNLRYYNETTSKQIHKSQITTYGDSRYDIAMDCIVELNAGDEILLQFQTEESQSIRWLQFDEVGDYWQYLGKL